MVVRVHTSPAAVKARKANIEFLLTNHPLDCPVCDKGGECPLQDQALMDGPGQSRYVEEKRQKNKRYPLGKLIVLDQERCVLCWRCIRFLDEWADDHELDLFGRGASTRIDTFPGRTLTSKWQGNTIDVCPVGALTSRVFRFEARVWELTETASVCPMCSVGCNILLGVKNQKLRRITPRENLEVNDVWICDKGRFGHAYVDHADRLNVPLIRRNGGLQPATWDEALALIAERLSQAIREYGPQATGGLGSTRVTNEANYLFQRFMRAIVGSNNVDHLDRMPAGVAPLGPLPELEHKDLFLLLGCDPSTEVPLVELWIKKAVLRHGARLLAIHPRRIELAGNNGLWLGYRPGSEAVLINGLARAVLVGSAGDGSVGDQRPSEDELGDWLEAYDPERVEEMTGVPAEILQEAAKSLVQARQPAVLFGPDWVQGAAAEVNLDLLQNLLPLLGSPEACFVARDANTLGALEMGLVPEFYPGGQSCGDNKVRSRLSSFWGGKLSPVPGLDFDGMMVAGREDRLKALWIMGTDPVHERWAAGEVLGRIPFVVVQDLFMTQSASLADVVLPAASFAETDGSYVNLTGRWQAVRAAKRPPGEARPNWWITAELARRMAEPKRQRAWDFAGPANVLDEIVRVLGQKTADYRGLDYQAMGSEGWQRPAPQSAARKNLVRAEPAPVDHDANYPLTLITGPLLYDRGLLLRHSEQIQQLVPDAFVMIHPADAERLELVAGDVVSVVSSRDEVMLTVRIGNDIPLGTVYAPLNLSDVPLSVLSVGDGAPIRVRIVR
jgi:predicted molibdopterin-dependent oxidoreductase YjgC